MFLSNLFERRRNDRIKHFSQTFDDYAPAGFELPRDRLRTGNFTISLAFVVRERKDRERAKLPRLRAPQSSSADESM